MAAYGDRGNGQPWFALQDLSDALHLVVEFSSLDDGECGQRFDRDVQPASGAAAVPDPRNGAVDEQYRKVAGLTTGERALRGRSGEESLTRVAANGVGVEVWQ